MFFEKLKNYNVLLASNSKRRHELLNQLGVQYKIINQNVDESFSNELKGSMITDYLAKKKSSLLVNNLKKNDILITSDTIVWHKNTALGKPTDANDAFQMLRSLSGQTHEVITSVCFKTSAKLKTINSITKVTFKQLSNSEINYYIKNFKVLDKAGSYGIQDWIGQIAVTKIEGSYFNVMGFPMDKIYNTLLTF